MKKSPQYLALYGKELFCCSVLFQNRTVLLNFVSRSKKFLTQVDKLFGRYILGDLAYQNKKDCDSNQLEITTSVERATNNNSKKYENCYQFRKSFHINCFVVVVTLICKSCTVWKWFKLKLVECARSYN